MMTVKVRDEHTLQLVTKLLQLEVQKAEAWQEPNFAEEIHQCCLRLLYLAYRQGGHDIASSPPIEMGDLFLALNKIARMATIHDPSSPSWEDSLLDAMLYLLRAGSKLRRMHCATPKQEEEEEEKKHGDA